MTAGLIVGGCLGLLGMIVLAWHYRATETELVDAQVALASLALEHERCESDLLDAQGSLVREPRLVAHTEAAQARIRRGNVVPIQRDGSAS